MLKVSSLNTFLITILFTTMSGAAELVCRKQIEQELSFRKIPANNFFFSNNDAGTQNEKIVCEKRCNSAFELATTACTSNICKFDQMLRSSTVNGTTFKVYIKNGVPLAFITEKQPERLVTRWNETMVDVAYLDGSKNCNTTKVEGYDGAKSDFKLQLIVNPRLCSNLIPARGDAFEQFKKDKLKQYYPKACPQTANYPFFSENGGYSPCTDVYTIFGFAYDACRRSHLNTADNTEVCYDCEFIPSGMAR
jgi:hypothetical protein